jgi:hypothetical protein
MREAYLDLAQQNPAALRCLVRERRIQGLELSFAIEALGYTRDATTALPLLLLAIEDENDSVREGAVHGLSMYLEVPSIRDWLVKVGATDTSPKVRLAVRENLT